MPHPSESPTAVDVHAHVITPETMARMRRESSTHGPRLIESDTALQIGDLRLAPFERGGWDVEKRLAHMDATGVKMQAVSSVPFLFFYYLEPSLAIAMAQIQNEGFAQLAREHPGRFVGLAALPMQDPEAAATELRRAVRDLGLRGAGIGANVDGRNLDDPALEPVWAAADDLGAFVFVHPELRSGTERMQRYYLRNLIGNPLDTSLAIASLIFGGVVERYPRAKFCFAHGGGFIPYQRGRLEHGWRVRNEPKVQVQRSPKEYFGALYFDTILHSPIALRYLVESAGADRVMVGSDYPFDMGPADPVAEVRDLGLDAPREQSILSGTAERLLKLGS